MYDVFKDIFGKGVVFLPRQPKNFDPRQQMKTPDFELQYKRDANLKDVALHHHDFYEIYFLLSGDVTYLIESKIVHVMPGDLLLIPPGELHQVIIRPEMSVYERYVLWVDPQFIQRLSSASTDLKTGLESSVTGGSQLRLDPEDRSRVRSLLDLLARENGSDGFGTDLMGRSLLTQLLVTINRLASRGGIRMYEDTRTNRAVTQVMDYVNLHYAEPLSLDMLAEKFFVSKYHLSHEFNRQVGTSVYHYIQKKRLLIARQLLAQGKKPSQVYSACGFSDYTGFFRAFKAEYGVSPREFASAARQWNTERLDTE